MMQCVIMLHVMQQVTIEHLIDQPSPPQTDVLFFPSLQVVFIMRHATIQPSTDMLITEH